MSPEAVYDLWATSLGFAFTLAKGVRAAELRGDRRSKTFDARGLHLYSVEWGRVWACEELMPDLARLRATGDFLLDAVSMRSKAAREAEAEFEVDARAGRIDWHHG